MMTQYGAAAEGTPPGTFDLAGDRGHDAVCETGSCSHAQPR